MFQRFLEIEYDEKFSLDGFTFLKFFFKSTAMF